MKRSPWILLVGVVAGCSFASAPPRAADDPARDADRGDAPRVAAPASAEIDAYIASLPYLPLDAASVTEGAPSAPLAEGDYACTTRSLTETRQYDRIVAYAAN